MKNQKEIYKALLAGETLISSDGKKKLHFNVNNTITDHLGVTDFQNFSSPSNWQIYKKPKWYENIPDGGVLCDAYDRNDKGFIVVIDVYEKGNEFPYESVTGDRFYRADPLTKRKMQVFMDNAPEEI